MYLPLSVCWLFVLEEKKMAVVMCRQSFKKRDAQMRHYIEDHSVPEGDEILGRYVQLHFSSSTRDAAWNQKTLVRLLI